MVKVLVLALTLVFRFSVQALLLVAGTVFDGGISAIWKMLISHGRTSVGLTNYDTSSFVISTSSASLSMSDRHVSPL
jgi:hypothetical protein